MNNVIIVLSRVVKAVVTFGIIFGVIISLTFAAAFVVDSATPLYFRIFVVFLLAVVIAQEFVPARKKTEVTPPGEESCD